MADMLLASPYWRRKRTKTLVATILGLIVLGLGALFAIGAQNYLQTGRFDIRPRAYCGGASNCSVTCANGKSFSDSCPANGAFQSCSQWASEACGTVGSAPGTGPGATATPVVGTGALCTGTNTHKDCVNNPIGTSCATNLGTCQQNGTAGGIQCGCVLNPGTCVESGPRNPPGKPCCSGILRPNGECAAPGENAPTPAPDGTCPRGQSYCGGCIAGCKETSQKTCNDWIAEECAVGGSGNACQRAGGGCYSTPNCSRLNRGLVNSGNGCGDVAQLCCSTTTTALPTTSPTTVVTSCSALTSQLGCINVDGCLWTGTACGGTPVNLQVTVTPTLPLCNDSQVLVDPTSTANATRCRRQLGSGSYAEYWQCSSPYRLAETKNLCTSAGTGTTNCATGSITGSQTCCQGYFAEYVSGLNRYVCNRIQSTNKPIGQPCTLHSECASGFCAANDAQSGAGNYTCRQQSESSLPSCGDSVLAAGANTANASRCQRSSDRNAGIYWQCNSGYVRSSTGDSCWTRPNSNVGACGPNCVSGENGRRAFCYYQACNQNTGIAEAVYCSGKDSKGLGSFETVTGVRAPGCGGLRANDQSCSGENADSECASNNCVRISPELGGVPAVYQCKPADYVRPRVAGESCNVNGDCATGFCAASGFTGRFTCQARTSEQTATCDDSRRFDDNTYRANTEPCNYYLAGFNRILRQCRSGYVKSGGGCILRPVSGAGVCSRNCASNADGSRNFCYNEACNPATGRGNQVYCEGNSNGLGSFYRIENVRLSGCGSLKDNGQACSGTDAGETECTSGNCTQVNTTLGSVPAVYQCQPAGFVRQRAAGESCSSNGECTSGLCASLGSSTTQTCQARNQSTLPGCDTNKSFTDNASRANTEACYYNSAGFEKVLRQCINGYRRDGDVCVQQLPSCEQVGGACYQINFTCRQITTSHQACGIGFCCLYQDQEQVDPAAACNDPSHWYCNGQCAGDDTRRLFNSTWRNGSARWRWEAARNSNSCGGFESEPLLQTPIVLPDATYCDSEIRALCEQEGGVSCIPTDTGGECSTTPVPYCSTTIEDTCRACGSDSQRLERGDCVETVTGGYCSCFSG